MNKKANFNYLSAGLISFIGFVLITLMVIFVLSTMKGTTMVCDPNGVVNATQTYYNGTCLICPYNLSSVSYYNSTDNRCYNGTGVSPMSTESLQTSPTAIWNGTTQLLTASLLPPQFASLIIIVIIVVAVLGLLALIGYNAYQKMK